jgi:cation diffusion facilitator family transporter
MVADGIHAVFDAGSNIICLIALAMSVRGPDPEHPYGHRKFEIVGASVIGLFMAAAAWQIGVTAIDRFRTGEGPNPTMIQFGVLGVTIVINLFITLYESRKGRELGSVLLVADSAHTRIDLLAKITVLGSLIGARMGLPILDPIVALVLAGYAAFVAIRLILSSAHVLADRAILDPKEVKKVVEAMPDVEDCHEIRSRGIERWAFVDLRIHVDPEVTLKRAHRISHEVEIRIREAFPGVVDVIVHVEPAGLVHN